MARVPPHALHPRPNGARALACAASVLAAFAAGLVFLVYGAADGLSWIDAVRAGLISLSTWWLAWGAATALLGLTAHLPAPPTNTNPIRGTTVIIVPVYNEDPRDTFARIAAMDASLHACGPQFTIDFAVLSDTRDDAIAADERQWFAHLTAQQAGAGRMFYRRRTDNTGRKAGNIEDFITTSGAAWDYAVILDADSLMEGATVLEMIRRMEGDPSLGLLQTLPKTVGAQTLFGRAMQFSAVFHSPAFARGVAAMQGRSGPFWGHNAIVRMRAWAESCGLPVLSGPPPFGGHILSHDSVEAALLARAGWTVRLDDDLQGSYEGGPENIIDHAKRDRRWCQGNLQHTKVIRAPGLLAWNRFSLFQGIFAYAAPLIWLAFIAASIAAIPLADELNYFPQANWPFPVFPNDQTSKAIGLALGVFGLLVMPKLLVALDAIRTGRARGFGGAGKTLRAVLAELALTSLIAPILLAFQSRSVIQVLLGRDGGWPTNNRGDGGLSAQTAWVAGRWIMLWGAGGIAVTQTLAPVLTLWLMPVALPMILAPLLIWWTARPAAATRFSVPQDSTPPPILARHAAILAAWTTPIAKAKRA
ncbi:membrane glycosyltransferase [Pseudorhodobacter antarcticus]|uniref:Glucans biosynthesis glucosyltransferase H n=1 Tax=Pseudorhodobacter antarcticus TaxID=1077947 RepID=A0A1H8KQ62_9RHOB|nr:glucans biosynthesis glucosyltransferase MdoH [Pseudorhodobacter antarcticus]SEN95025.1 membrane glycosyltransferase [Pseudorhodobacter antarcticus]